MKRILLSEKIKKAPPFLTIEPYLRSQDKPIASHPEAREPRLVPLVVIDYGSVVARLKTIKHVGKFFIPQRLRALGRYMQAARRHFEGAK